MPRCILLSLIALAISSAVFAAEPTLRWTGHFERTLSAYGLSAPQVTDAPSVSLMPYDIVTPLFSDYAEKYRFIALPPGAAMTYHEVSAFDLPVGATLVKSFAYPADFRDPTKGRRLIETRLLFHTEAGWKGAAYLWNDDETEAVLKVAGARVPVSWLDIHGAAKSTDYLVPNMNQCGQCHGGFGSVAPLGLKARHLNRPFGPEGLNQLAAWAEKGLLRDIPAPEAVPKVAKWNDPALPLEARAGAYFDINCGHCHNPKGYASGTGLVLAAMEEANRMGIYHRPTAAGNASRGSFFAVVPGNPGGSFLLTRLMSTEADVRMPEVGRTLAHEEGVALIRDWIASLQTSK